MNLLVALLVVVAYLAFFLLVIWVIARFGGWHELVGRYPASSPFPEKNWRFRSVALRASGGFPVGYNGCIRTAVDLRGLYLEPMLIFHFAHEPIRLPWEEMTLSSKRYFLQNYVAIRMTRLPDMEILLGKALAEKIFSDAGQRQRLPVS